MQQPVNRANRSIWQSGDGSNLAGNAQQHCLAKCTVWPVGQMSQSGNRADAPVWHVKVNRAKCPVWQIRLRYFDFGWFVGRNDTLPDARGASLCQTGNDVHIRAGRELPEWILPAVPVGQSGAVGRQTGQTAFGYPVLRREGQPTAHW